MIQMDRINPKAVGTGIYYVDRWMNTPGTLDETGFNNVISHIQSNGPLGYAGRRMGTVFVPPGQYNIRNTITVPLGINIQFFGLGQETVWGPVLASAVNGLTCMQVNADAVGIFNLTFLGNGGIGVGLGTNGGQTTFDTFINHCWFNNWTQAIYARRYSGGDFSHNTLELNSYGLFISQPSGDNFIQDIQALDLRCYSNSQCGVYIDGGNVPGTGVNNSQIIRISGIFDYNGTAGANIGAVQLNGVTGAQISGHFDHNINDDIHVTLSNDVVISGCTSTNTGRQFINVNGISGLSIVGNSQRNCNLQNVGGTTAVILGDNLTNTSIIGNTVAADAALNKCSYSIYVGAASVGTTVAGNNVIAQQTGKYSILDPTAAIVDYGQLQVYGPGSTSLASSLGVFGSDGAATAGNIYGVGVNKSGTETLFLGVNKNTTTGSVPANAAFLSTFGNGILCLGRGAANGLPSTADIQIGTSGDVTLKDAIVTSAAPTVSAGQVGIGSTTATTVGAAGGASALPATPSGYLIINVAGTNFKLPYYAN